MSLRAASGVCDLGPAAIGLSAFGRFPAWPIIASAVGGRGEGYRHSRFGNLRRRRLPPPAAARPVAGEMTATEHVIRADMRGIGAAVGTAVHAAAVTLKERLRSSTRPPRDEARDAPRDAMHKAFAEEVVFDRDLPAADAAEIRMLRMADAWREGIAPQVKPVAVEERLEAEALPGPMLSGQSDVIAREAVRDVIARGAVKKEQPPRPRWIRTTLPAPR